MASTYLGAGFLVDRTGFDVKGCIAGGPVDVGLQSESSEAFTDLSRFEVA